MSQAKIKTWVTGETLTAADLNAEIDNILNAQMILVSPANVALDMNGKEVTLDADGDSGIVSDTDDRIDLKVGGVDLFRFDGTTANSVNGIDFQSAATSSSPKINAVGTDTNVDLTLDAKGTGSVFVQTPGDLGLIDTTEDTLEGPVLLLRRINTARANNDYLGSIVFRGYDDADANNDYAYIKSRIIDVSAGSEDGALVFGTSSGGPASDTLHIRNGVFTASVADMGADTINATTLYQGGVEASPIGYSTIWVPAGGMRPTVSNGCAPLVDVEVAGGAGKPDMQVLDFDPGTDEFAQFSVTFPKSWDKGVVKCWWYWTTTATDTDVVVWGIQGLAVGDGEDMDTAYGTAVTQADAVQSASEYVYRTPLSGEITIGGTIGEGDLTFFRVFRDANAGGDTMGEDARLLGVKIIYTLEAGNDS